MKYIIDIPEIPKNDKQRWVVANGTPYEERQHGKWVESKQGKIPLYISQCSNCGEYSPVGNFCIWCGSDNRRGASE